MQQVGSRVMTFGAEVWTNTQDDQASQYQICERAVDEDALNQALQPQGDCELAIQDTIQSIADMRIPALFGICNGQSTLITNSPDANELSEYQVILLGIPQFLNKDLAYISLFYFASDSSKTGAVELWQGTSGRFELGVTQGFYSNLNRFAMLSQYVNFPIGSGLPGMVWQTAHPRLIVDLANSVQFMRSTGAESAGLSKGFGYPVIEGSRLKSVILMLSSNDSPLMTYHSVWSKQIDQMSHSEDTDYQNWNLIEWDSDEILSSKQLPKIGQIAVKEKRPVLSQHPQQVGLPASGNFNAAIALPVLEHDVVRAIGVLAW